MERNNRRKPNSMGKINTYYIIGGLSLLFLIVAIATYISYSNSKNKISKAFDTEKIGQINTTVEEASNPIGKSVNEMKNEINNTTEKIAINTSTMTNSTNTNNTKKENTKEKNIETSTKTQKESESKEENKEITFIRPVNGDIINKFAKDNLIFSKTLNEWVTHLGIDMRAEKTEVVKASAAGTVKAIKNDPRYGLSITIEHDGGYKTVYANLLTSEFVVEGEKVEQGQTIGTVGNTATFECLEDSHLHFEILKDNENIDPETLLK